MDKEVRHVHDVDRKIIETLVETKAINFEAIGRTIASVGAASVFVDDGFERWCGSDLRIYKWPRHGFDLEDLGVIREIARGQLGR